MSSELLERLIDAVVVGSLAVPPITRIELGDVPMLNRNARANGKTVITL
jgi:hypothetical protein